MHFLAPVRGLRRFFAYLVTLSAAGALHGQPASPVWSAAEELRIGRVDDPRYGFSIGVTVTVGSGGTIYALDPQSSQVRVFDARGRLVRTFGREGPGPGEFQAADALGWLGDTLWVIDPAQYRVTFFRPDGSVIRTLQVAVRGSSRYGTRAPMAMLADGSALAVPAPGAMLVTSGAVKRVPLLRVSRRGEPLDTVDWHSTDHSVFEVASGEGQRRVFMYQPFKDTPIVAVAPDGRSFVVVERAAAARPDGASFRVTRLSARGDTIFSRRYQYTPSPLSPAFRRTWAAEQGGELVAGRAGLNRREVIARIEEQLYVPPFRPPVTAAVVGRDGTVWLRREEGASDFVLWHVLNERGLIEASVRLPKKVYVHQASRSHFWGVTHDELDVPYVVRYRVVVPAPRRR